MPEVRLPLATQSAVGRSKAVSLENLVNCFIHPNPQGSASPFSIMGTPGLVPWGDEQARGPCRGLTRLAGDIIAVIGNRVYAYAVTGESTDLGEIPGGDTVFIDHGKYHALINCEAGLFVVSRDDGVQNRNPQDPWRGAGAAYQDGFAIAGLYGSQQFNVSDVEDGASGDGMLGWGALNFTSADSAPDNLVSIISDHREVKIFKERTIENYVNVGDPDFPFQRTGAGLLERGLIAPHSVAKADNRVYWLGDDLRVYVESGGQPQAVSTLAIDDRIAELASPQTATAFVYAQRGHTFYCLNFRDASLVFDVSTGRWHERSSYNTSDGGKSDGRWRAQHHIFQWNKNIVGDFENGQLYELDLNTYTDDGDRVLREWVHPMVTFGGKYSLMRRLRYEVERGVVGSGETAPQIGLDWSDDQGGLWSNRLYRGTGVIGERRTRVEFWRLGGFRNRHLRGRTAANAKLHIVDAFIDVERTDR